MKKVIHLAVMGLIVLGLYGCEAASVAQESFSPKGACWNITDTLALTHQIDAKERLQLKGSLEFTDGFPFSNVYFYLEVSSPDGQVQSSPLEFPLMDEEGNWYGKGKGKSIDVSLNLPEVYTQKGNWSFKLVHHMQKDELCGVSSVKLKLVSL